MPKRFDFLVDEIRAITHTTPTVKKLAAMKDLATHLRIFPSKATYYFSGTPGAPVPSAKLTLGALSWVCDIRGRTDPTVENLIVPDWSTLRYFLFRLCYGTKYDYTRTCKALKTAPDDLRRLKPNESTSPETLANVLGVGVGRIKAIVPYSWKSSRVRVDGNFALDFLALHHRNARNRQIYVDYLIDDLVPLTGARTVPLGFPGRLSPGQNGLVTKATGLRTVYCSKRMALPRWLRKIVM